MRIICSIEILKPPEIVFPWLAEPEKAMQWQKNVKGGEILLNTPEVIGTTFTEVVEEDGNSLEMHGVITKYARNQIIAFQLASKIHTVDVSYALEESHKTTQITVDASIGWKFPISLVSIFNGRKMKAGITKQMEAELLVLKSICEAADQV